MYRLQTDDDPECKLFRRAVHGHDRPSRGTMQGIYVFAAGGVLLGRLNSLDPDAVAAMLESALEKWETVPAADRSLPPGARITPRHRWEDSYPESGLVLVRTARDLAAGFDPGAEPLRPFNRDQAWFSHDEARRWLPRELRVGAVHAVPRALVERLARFHLVDNVRGQTIPFAEVEVEGSALSTEITAIDGDSVSLRIAGMTAAVALGPWLLGDSYWKPNREWPHSVHTEVRGFARWDRKQERFVEFELLAVGVRSGRTINNGRGRERTRERRPIGIFMTLSAGAPRVAPTFINVYDADWVRHPGE